MSFTEPNPELGDAASWLYAITQSYYKRYTQTITYYPGDGGYRTRIRLFDLVAGGLDLKWLWDFQDGLFESPDEALEFGELVVTDDSRAER